VRGWVVRIEPLGNLGVICILPEITQTLHAYYPAALKMGFVLGDEKRVLPNIDFNYTGALC
jgi:hypothetical protein